MFDTVDGTSISFSKNGLNYLALTRFCLKFSNHVFVCDFLLLGDGLDHCMQVKKQQIELNMEQQTGSNCERSMSNLYIVTLLN